MRLDKFLKLSRVIKRRTVANEVCSTGRVTVNGKVAKPGTKLKIGDIVSIMFARIPRNNPKITIVLLIVTSPLSLGMLCCFAVLRMR